jgi:rare lipoprotein A
MRIRTAHGLAVLLVIVGLGAAQGPTSSGSSKPPNASYNSTAVTAKATPVRARPYQVGTASWYGSDFEGKPTASGEPYDMYDLTAAHLTLPLGSHVRVTNLRNGRAVVVRINDRGPIVPGRIIDLSYGAAQMLGVKARGLQRVRLDVVKPRLQTAPQTVALLHPLAY